MAKRSYGAGTLFQRGKVWYVALWIDGRQIQKSSKSKKREDAVRLRDQLLGRKARGELRNASNQKIRCGELLDDLLEHIEANRKHSTFKVWNWVIEANIRPFFGPLKVEALTTERLKEYRKKRLAQGKLHSTCNRELSILRTALHLGRKSTPPKVTVIPYFPIMREENVRQGFLGDDQYSKLRDSLEDELKPLFVAAYSTGVRLGELLAWSWDQVDFEQGFITLQKEETKAGHARAVPILEGDMRQWLLWAREHSNGCEQVFNRCGAPIKNFRASWMKACAKVGVPDLKFHDLRRSAVRNMRRAGVPQVVRMRITGHLTDSMERRYNIVDTDDIQEAKKLMERRNKKSDEQASESKDNRGEERFA